VTVPDEEAAEGCADLGGEVEGGHQPNQGNNEEEEVGEARMGHGRVIKTFCHELNEFH
jgi:hypothetical protein